MEPSGVWEALAVDSLRLESLVEEDVGRAHHNVIDHSSCGNEVDQPSEDFGRTVTELQEGEAGEAHDHEKAKKRHSALCAVAKECWSASLKGKSIERTSRTVGVGVARGENRGDQEGVDQIRQPVDTEVLHGNNVGGRGTSATTRRLSTEDGCQSWIVVGNQDTNGESSHDEEDAETPVHSLEGSFNVYPWPSGFSSDHADVLGTDNREGCRPESCEETLEAAKRTGAQMLRKSTGLSPVPEAISVSMRVPSTHCDECEGEQHHDQHDLAARQPELGFTVGLDREAVQQGIAHDAGSDDRSSRNIVSPKAQHGDQGGDLEGNQKSLVEEEVPSGHETVSSVSHAVGVHQHHRFFLPESIVDPFTSKTNEATRDGHEDRHFSDAVVDQTKHAGVERVGNEQTAGPTMVKTSTDRDEEGGTDRSTNGQQLNLSVAQAALEVVLVLGNDSMASVDVVGVDLDVNILLAAEIVQDTHDG